MKLYSGPLSLFTAKVRIALREKGVEAELVEVPFGPQGYEPKHPEVLRLSPKAQVPVLVDGDLVLTDSTVILEYLEDLHPEPALYPREPAARAACRQLELHADEVIFPPILTLIREVFYKPDGAGRDESAVEAARKAIREGHGELETRLGDATWFSGDAFGVADIGLLLDCMFAASLGEPIAEEHARLRAWQDRALSRPALAQEAQEMTAYAAALASR